MHRLDRRSASTLRLDPAARNGTRRPAAAGAGGR